MKKLLTLAAATLVLAACAPKVDEAAYNSRRARAAITALEVSGFRNIKLRQPFDCAQQGVYPKGEGEWGRDGWQFIATNAAGTVQATGAICAGGNNGYGPSYVVNGMSPIR